MNILILFILAFLAWIPVSDAAQSCTTTSNYSLAKCPAGYPGPAWVSKLNNNMDLIDAHTHAQVSLNPRSSPYNATGDLERYTDGVWSAGNLSSASRSCAAADVGGVLVVNDAIDSETSIVNATYQWTLSGSGTSNYFVEYSAGPGNNAELPPPDEVLENGTPMVHGTLGALAAGEWAYGTVSGDAIGTGQWTVYVRLSDSTDPDSKVNDYVELNTWDALVTTVASCSGNNFVPTLVPDETGSGRTFLVGTDDTTALVAWAAAVQSSGAPAFVPAGMYYSTQPIVIDHTSTGSNTNNDVIVQCERGATFVRSPACNSSGGNCTYTGSSVSFLMLAKADATVMVNQCTVDGASDFEANDTTDRMSGITAAAGKTILTNNVVYRTPSYGLQSGFYAGRESRYLLVTGNEVDGAWEGGLLVIGTSIGTSSRWASHHVFDNQFYMPIRHPNANVMPLNNTGIDYETSGASSEWYVDLVHIGQNQVEVGGDVLSFGRPSISFSDAGGNVRFRNALIDGNNLVCTNVDPWSDNADPACDATPIKWSLMNLDEAGHGSATLTVTNNNYEHKDSGTGAVGWMLLQSGLTAASTNVYTKLRIANNFAGNTQGQSNPMYRIIGDWDRVDIDGAPCARNVSAEGTNYTGCVKFDGSVRTLTHRGVGGWEGANIGNAPFVFTDGERYGLQPGVQTSFARSNVDDGDRLNLFKMAGGDVWCFDLVLTFRRMQKIYNDVCPNNLGATGWRVVMPDEAVADDSGKDAELIILENNSNVVEVALWQREDDAGSDMFVVGVTPVSRFDNGYGFGMTYNTTDDGAQSLPTQPLNTKRPMVRWYGEIGYASFTAAATSEAVTVLTVPTNWKIQNVRAQVETAFNSGATCVTTDLTATVGDSDDPDGYLVTWEPDTNTNLRGLNDTETGVYDPENGSPDSLAVWGGYIPDQAAIAVTLDCGGNNLGDGATSFLDAGIMKIWADLTPIN